MIGGSRSRPGDALLVKDETRGKIVRVHFPGCKAALLTTALTQFLEPLLKIEQDVHRQQRLTFPARAGR